MTTQHIAMLWNPTKADRVELEDALEGALQGDSAAQECRPEISWWETTSDDNGQGIAADAVRAGADLLLVAGGDGTVQAVAEYIGRREGDDARARAVDVGIVPLGTGNLLARNLGIPLDAAAAVSHALARDVTEIDLGWVDIERADTTKTRHAFTVIIGFGIDAQMIAETDSDLKSKVGWLAYVESLGRAVAASDVTSFDLRLGEDSSRAESAHSLLIGNCGSLQGGLTLLPDADPSDGVLDYIVLRADGAGEWFETVRSVVWENGVKRFVGGLFVGEGDDSRPATTATAPDSNDSLSYGRATQLEVRLPEPKVFQIDGDDVGEVTGFDVSIQPGVLRVRA